VTIITLLSQLLNAALAFINRLGRSLAAFFDGIDEARVMTERLLALSHLSDEELARRGLTRDEIPTAVLAKWAH
jgi:hypothetical protein